MRVGLLQATGQEINCRENLATDRTGRGRAEFGLSKTQMDAQQARMRQPASS